MSPSPIAVLTLMRGEVELVEDLDRQLDWTPEWHIIETERDAPVLRLTHPNARIHHHPLPLGANFDEARAAALPHVRAPWLLVLDTDERLAAETVERLSEAATDFESRGIAGAWMPRLNHILDQPVTAATLWPDLQLRLVRSDRVSFPTQLHDKYTVDGPVEHLPINPKWALLHYPYRSTEQFLAKMNVYTSIEATQPGPPSNPARAAAHAARHFLTRYLRQGGVQQGHLGLHFCLVSAFVRYLALAKRWEQGRICEVPPPPREPQ